MTKYHFNSPPGWPTPPAADWQPPAGWQPDPSWPAAPPGWSFWLTSEGTRGFGPSGRYGATPRGKYVAGGVVGGVVLIMLLAAVDGTDPSAAGSPTATATATATALATVTKVVPGPATTVTAPPPAARIVTVRPPQATTTVTVRAPLARSTTTTATTEPRSTEEPAPSAYYANCKAAKAAGVAPLYRGDPGYRSGLDGDDDGVACET